ncbi:hypothetical protein BPT24_060 [Tenacibaculum phage pT24]|uniref:Uncharacterized protein n=1 Tax=Tenacibaculum phage pT24 TaxID=1880590 RepID=A0A1B4XWI8_9CAUD|nr:hypothetical protein HYP10_gp060 [Tenacibaculum phage pT24]BAV39183.1 hypothetical protein BPT24_060 [Tenacibaculum phage pT24]
MKNSIKQKYNKEDFKLWIGLMILLTMLFTGLFAIILLNRPY